MVLESPLREGAVSPCPRPASSRQTPPSPACPCSLQHPIPTPPGSRDSPSPSAWAPAPPSPIPTIPTAPAGLGVGAGSLAFSRAWEAPRVPPAGCPYDKQHRPLWSKNFPGPCFGFSKDRTSTFLGTEGRPDSLTCQHLEWKTRSSSTRDEVLITPHIPACINTAERSKKSTLPTRRAFPGVTRSLLCPGSRVSSPVGSNLLLLGLQGFTEELRPRCCFLEEKSSTLGGAGNGDAAGCSLGWVRPNGAGVALWAPGTSATPIPKHRRMLRAADISHQTSSSLTLLLAQPNGERDLMPNITARVKLPHLHPRLPGSHMPTRHRR